MTALTATRPEPAAVLELLKPVTWFPPVWAYACGVVASGAAVGDRWPLVLLGLGLAGPLVCAMSQAANDWYDRHVDAINEPHRPIPSGRIPGEWGFWIAVAWTALSLLVGAALGPWGFGATVLAVVLAWIYSAPPLRLKRNGWWGNAVCGAAYETLPWVTAAAVTAGAAPSWELLLIASLYGLGAHGIMTLNDFKSIKGDTATGIRSLPVQLGAERAARVARIVMLAPQLVVVALLALWNAPIHAAAILALAAGQVWLMRAFVADPLGRARWYSAVGVPLYVLGMMVSAHALGAM